MSKLNAKDILEALRRRHADRNQWAFFEEFRAGTGYRNWRLAQQGINPERRLDAWALNLYKSKKHKRITYEIKVSRSDFLNELKNPLKRKPGLDLSNEFYFVAPVGLIKPEEVPEECGLIEVNENLTSKVIVKAPYRDGGELTWNFVAAIARRIQRIENRR